MTRHELRTSRLSLRRWRESDREPFAAMNADPEVMRWFPAPLDRAESRRDASSGSRRVHEQLGLHGVGRRGARLGARCSAVRRLRRAVRPRFELPAEHADPCVEVGWRLDRQWWGLGIATEAATESLRFAFDDARPPRGAVWTVPPNLASQAVMQRLGMRYSGVFEHPLAAPGDWWRPHVLYRATVDDRPRRSD